MRYTFNKFFFRKENNVLYVHLLSYSKSKTYGILKRMFNTDLYSSKIYPSKSILDLITVNLNYFLLIISLTDTLTNILYRFEMNSTQLSNWPENKMTPIFLLWILKDEKEWNSHFSLTMNYSIYNYTWSNDSWTIEMGTFSLSVNIKW